MSYDHGRFVWFEHISTDTDAAARFYGEVLSWGVNKMEMGDFTYPMITVGEGAVGGYVNKADVPPSWLAYLSVEDVDASARAVVENGGSVMAEPFSIPGVGRMAVVIDPQGGAFSLFKAETTDGPEPEGLGTFHWMELWAKDGEAAVAFYEKTFGFTHSEMQMPNGTYYVLQNGESMRGGIMTSPRKDVPTMWLPYVAVDDADAAMTRVTNAGGKVHAPPMDVPGVGRFGIIQDPQGAVIGLIKPAAKG